MNYLGFMFYEIIGLDDSVAIIDYGLANIDGTITYTEFHQGVLAFADKWKRVCFDHNYDLPSWSWVSCSNRPFMTSHEVDGYLSLEQMCFLRHDKKDDNRACHVVEKELKCLEIEDSTDPAMLAQPENVDMHYYDFHIVYSNSYRIPVLYFRGYSSDGHPLGFNQIEQDLPADSAKVLTEAKWTFITQQEHPYLNRPWYTLHPCGTNKLMQLLSNPIMSKGEDAAEFYIISWLSVVSQVIGLRIPSELGIRDQT